MQFFKKLPRKLLIGIALVSVVIGVGAVYFFMHMNKPQVEGATAPPPVPQNIKSLLKEVEAKTEIPPDEVPTVATITDLSKLDQAFFLKAQKGDKVLMFINAQQAYLYRPSSDQVINKGRLELVTEEVASESAEQTATDSAEKTDSSVLRVKF